MAVTKKAASRHEEAPRQVPATHEAAVVKDAGLSVTLDRDAGRVHVSGSAQLDREGLLALRQQLDSLYLEVA